MNSIKLTALITTLANAISCNLSASELAFLSTVFVQLGDTLSTIVAERELCNNDN